jgi:hypothetical protein
MFLRDLKGSSRVGLGVRGDKGDAGRWGRGDAGTRRCNLNEDELNSPVNSHQSTVISQQSSVNNPYHLFALERLNTPKLTEGGYNYGGGLWNAVFPTLVGQCNQFLGLSGNVHKP